MAGSISTLGVGSGLQLQDILDQLKAVDQKVVDRSKTDIAKYTSQLDEFTVVNNKLLTMKSAALNLSLSSTYIGRTVTSSSESVVAATVVDGTTVKSTSLTVNNLAQQSSWMSQSGVASVDGIVYVPTSQVSSGVTNPATDPIATGVGTLKISFGPTSSITVDVDAGTMMDDSGASGLSLVSLINNDAENAGKVTASTYVAGTKTYLRIETATAGGSGEANRVGIATNGTTLTFAPPDKLLQIQVNGDSTSLSVAAETTLSQLVAQINDATDNPGITATAINDGVISGKPYKLAVTANGYGEDNRILFLTDLPDLDMEALSSQSIANSLNAQFTVDGIPYQRQSNTVSDIQSGLTLTLNGKGSSTVDVAKNDDGLKEMVKTLVTSYNEVVQELRDKTAYDSKTGEPGVLTGTTLWDLSFDLQRLMTSTNIADTDGNIKSLFDLGLTFERNGSITVDDTILTAAIKDHSDGVQAFFLGNSDNDIEGLADKVNNRLRTLTGSEGAIEGERNSAQSRIDDLNLKFGEDMDRLTRKYDQLSKQFVALDSYMNKMKSMSSFLTGQFNSLSSGWSGGSSSDK